MYSYRRLFANGDLIVRNLEGMLVEKLLFVPQIQNEWCVKNSNAVERKNRETAREKQKRNKIKLARVRIHTPPGTSL